MRIDSGLQGYYYEQGRFRRPEMDKDEPAQQAVTQPQRASSSAPIVESSTLLSSSLSSALWALESGDLQPRSSYGTATPLAAAADEESADKVRALYQQFSGDFE